MLVSTPAPQRVLPVARSIARKWSSVVAPTKTSPLALISEPRRLAHRYLIDNTLFLLHAARDLAGLTSYAQDW